jgi:hypothetical protein
MFQLLRSCSAEDAHTQLKINKVIIIIIIIISPSQSGPGSSVGIATGYGLDGPGIESLAASVV